jgi:ParB family transcriptional regulator, chromosome partitioning protein
MALGNLKNLASLAQAARISLSGKQVLKLNLEEVKSKSDQVRKSFTGIQELADSLLQEGQIQPIIVSPKGEDGLYEIQKGERRWRACRDAGLPTVEAIVNEDDLSTLDATAGELIENIQRDDLTPLEIATALQRFVDGGWKQKDIAKRIGKTVSFVSSHLSLLKLPDAVLALYQQDVTQDPETLNNLRLLFDLNPHRCEQLCSAALTDGISRLYSREALNAVKKPKEESISELLQPMQVNVQNAVPAITPIETNTPVKPSIPEPTEWRSAKPSQLHFVVSVALDGEVIKGRILTDRVDQDTSYVWIELYNQQTIRIPANQLKLEKITLR